ncbi:choline-sulfatase [Rhodoligotrophos appendicifer]|uniref:choline-sulfatase n=1 Tax=Rhodoligotrophos appendicifer TaxID=987056 RepID=UPI0011859835|nr:choline-sulfatase [Rhodoligotrophos appendicifer]
MGKQPNIVLIMLDQLAPQSLPMYGHGLVKTPHLSALAATGVVFDNFYCNSALCGPSRFSMMTGQRNSRIGAFDNASDFPAAIPTFAHYLRLAGYRTCLAGKMHFVGPDQLHGFEDRVTTDVYPGDYGWTPTWDDPERVHWWFHNMLSVTEAGPYDRTLEMDYDEEVAWQGSRWLYDAARSKDERPFMLTVSYMHPHDPYLAPRPFWDWYRSEDIDMPRVAALPLEQRDPFSQRMWQLYDRGEYEVTDAHIRAARHGYYAMTSYADDLVGRITRTLKDLSLTDNTVVMVVADHGDMLGERGLWFKMVFYERSIRVPLIMNWPGTLTAGRVKENASLVDLLPTLMDIAGPEAPPLAAPVDGSSLLPLAQGSSAGWPDTVYGEYFAEGTTEPVFMIKRGTFKFVTAAGDPPQLFDTEADPDELVNLADDPAHTRLAAEFAAAADARWDSRALRSQVVASQQARLLVQDALLTGKVTPWDFQPLFDATKQYNRNYGGELYDTDRRARIPYREEPPKTRRR